MFYIDQTSTAFKLARQTHYTNVRFILKKKLLGKKFTEPHPAGLTQKVYQVTGIDSRIAAFFNDETNLSNLLVGTPEVLNGLKDRFKSKKSIASIKRLI